MVFFCLIVFITIVYDLNSKLTFKGFIVMFRTIFVAAFFLVSMNVGIVQAQEAAVEGKPASISDDLLKKKSDALSERVSNLMEGLDVQEVTHFMVMYSNYNIYSMVKSVRNDISVAVEKCAKNNPTIAKKVNSKFEDWDKSVGGNMAQSLGNIESLQLAQTYMPQSEIKSIYKLVDEMRDINSSRFEKTPVTTPAACNYMVSKMDETQEQMNTLLSATLQSYPNLMRQNQK